MAEEAPGSPEPRNGRKSSEGLAEKLEGVRKIRKRLNKRSYMVPIPSNEEGHKLLGTLAIQFNAETLLVMLEHYGVDARINIKPLEKQAG